MKMEERENGAFCLAPDEKLFEEGLIHFPETAGEKPRLNARRCSNCGVLFYPPKIICPKCREENTLETVQVGPYGKLFTYSVVRVGPPPYTGMTPYAIGYVDLDEGVRIFAQLAVESFSDLRIGMEMELIIDSLYTEEDGTKVIGYKFKPRS